MPNPFNQSDFEDDSRERLAELVTLKKGLRLESGCDKVKSLTCNNYDLLGKTSPSSMAEKAPPHP